MFIENKVYKGRHEGILMEIPQLKYIKIKANLQQNSLMSNN